MNGITPHAVDVSTDTVVGVKSRLHLLRPSRVFYASENTCFPSGPNDTFRPLRSRRLCAPIMEGNFWNARDPVGTARSPVHYSEQRDVKGVIGQGGELSWRSEIPSSQFWNAVGRFCGAFRPQLPSFRQSRARMLQPLGGPQPGIGRYLLAVDPASSLWPWHFEGLP